MAKKKRLKKTDDIYTILTPQQADTHLGKIGTLEREIEQLTQEADTEIAAIKATLKKQSEPTTKRIQKHIRSLEAFCKKHPEVFGKKRSCTMYFGVIGFHKSTKLSVSTKTTVDKIKAVFKSTAKRYLHLKEMPDKTALAKLTDEQLASVDARRKVTDDFFAEPDLTKVDATGFQNGS